MSKIKIYDNVDEAGFKVWHTQYRYFCPGCKHEHTFALVDDGGHHTFNMDLNNPTVTPSLVANFEPGKMCHSFIKDGKIQFLSDCFHELKNQTVEIPDFYENE